MVSNSLDSLTPTERAVLQSLLHNRDQKAIARELGISPETVKTHLRNAREKTGIRTSFALAKALSERVRHTPEWGMPRAGGGAPPPDVSTDVASSRPEGADRNGDAFHEERAVFDFDLTPFPHPIPPVVEKRNEFAWATRMMIVVGLAVLAIFVILLAFPLSESFQRFANVLDPPTR